jgi:hypothetical protein
VGGKGNNSGISKGNDKGNSKSNDNSYDKFFWGQISTKLKTLNKPLC